MALMNEILTEWTTPSGGGKLSVMYFEAAAATDEAQRAALGVLWGAVDAQLDNAVSWRVRTTGRQVESTTGALVGEWTDPTTQTGTGALVGQATADAVQALIRWNTGVVVAGRFLKGRTNVPGVESNGFTDGNFSSTVQTAFNNAVATFIAAGVGFGVWHRPGTAGAGSLHEVQSGSLWPEAAVLRRRRG